MARAFRHALGLPPTLEEERAALEEVPKDDELAAMADEALPADDELPFEDGAAPVPEEANDELATMFDEEPARDDEGVLVVDAGALVPEEAAVDVAALVPEEAAVDVAALVATRLLEAGPELPSVEEASPDEEEDEDDDEELPVSRGAQPAT